MNIAGIRSKAVALGLVRVPTSSSPTKRPCS